MSWDDDLDRAAEAAKEAAHAAAKSAPCTAVCPDGGHPCTYTQSDHAVHVCVQGHEWR